MAERAAATAASTSCAVPRAISPRLLPSLGSMTGMNSPSAGATQALAMKWLLLHVLLLQARAAREMHSAMARPTSVVEARPPMSGVRGPSVSTVSIALTIASAAAW